MSLVLLRRLSLTGLCCLFASPALAESWREEGHEEELRACGDVIADYRTG